MKQLCLILIRFYRRCISPYKRPCCRFIPTCSAYALEAFEKRGFFVGFGLTVRRICRCNPFGGYGYDPVPEKKMKLPRIDPHRRNGEDTPQGKDSDAVGERKETQK